MLSVNGNLKSCRNKNEKEYVVALTGHRNVAHVRLGVRPVIDLRHSSWISRIAGTQSVVRHQSWRTYDRR